jgi:hypothetical protein
MRAKYSSETVLSRWNRIAPPLLCMIFAALSVWSLAHGEYSTAGLQLAFTVFWLLAAVWDKLPAVPGRRHDS